MSEPDEDQGSRLAEIADRLRLAYALIGGQALNAWIQPRATDDYDFLLAPDREKVAAFEGELERLGLRVRQRQDNGAASGPDFVRLSNETGTFNVDIQAAKTHYQMIVIARAWKEEEGGFYAARPEDLVIMKLIAFRAQDQRDIALLIEGCELDWIYLEEWADVWEVRERLEGFRQ